MILRCLLQQKGKNLAELQQIAAVW